MTSESLWYFTKPGHPAHPGVIQRAVVQIADGVGIHEEGWSFASDAAQPAFKTFLAQIRALDQQMKEAMAAGGNPPRAPATIAVGGNWRPQGTETEAVISLSKYYYGLEFGSRIEDAYALADSSLRATLPFDRYSNFANDVLLKAGRLKDFTVKDIDWEKDPPQGPPGLYAAVDFSAEAEKGHLCGYLAWKRADDGFFTLVREETNIMDSSMSSDNVAKAKAQFRCAP